MFKNQDGTVSLKKILLTVVVVLLIVVIAIECVVIVPPGHTGVMVTLGKVSDHVLQEGMSLKIPFAQRVITMNNQIVKLEVSTEAFSKDLQTVSAVLAINYRIDKTMSYSIYKNIGLNYENVLVVPAANEVLKAVVAQYTASELVGDRSTVSVQLDNAIKEKLKKNIENLDGVLAQVEKIIATPYFDNRNFEELIWPLEELNDFNSDSIRSTNKALSKLIKW